MTVAALGIYLLVLRPEPVSAQAIIQKAQAAATSPVAGGVRTFVLSGTWQAQPTNARMNAVSGYQGDEQITGETKRWFQAPDRWRSESQVKILSPDGTKVGGYTSIEASDGKDVWQYDPGQNSVTVNRFEPAMNGKGDVSFFGEGVDNLSALFRQASTCYDPSVTGSATVAGRPVYVVDLDPTKCPSASSPEANGRQVIWVDKDTFFVLKQEQYSTDGKKLIIQSEVTSIEYNVQVDPALFTFKPPAGAKVLDGRPAALLPTPSAMPSPTAAAIVGATPAVTATLPSATTAQPETPVPGPLESALMPLAQQVDFPLFAPQYVPEGLLPTEPRLQPLGQVGPQLELSFVPASAEAGLMDALQKGVQIGEQKATYQSVIDWTAGADPMVVPEGKAWVRRGERNVDGTGSDSAALALRDGTLISASSFLLSPEELLKIAASLQPVPGGHAPLPEPTAPTLAEVRAGAPYPIFVPTWVPDGLVPEPPVNYRISYHGSDGTEALTVLNGTGLASDPRKAGDPVTLPNGLEAHFLAIEPQYGGPILWWVQEGTPIAISGPEMTQELLVKIAASMSKTAELGPTEPRPEPTPAAAPPTPTPMPTPAFEVLRPTWLPDAMRVEEQVQGDTVTLAFDSHPAGDPPHGVLTLTEMTTRITLAHALAPERSACASAGVSEGGAPDPQQSTETIGGHEVTVIRRGAENCVTFTWDAGDLRLTLTNAYDPPGQLRYSCEQLRKVVALIRQEP